DFREELLKTIDNAKKVGLQVSEGLLWRTFLDVDQRILDDLDEAEALAERMDAEDQLLVAKKEAKSIDLKTVDESSLQKVRDNLGSALERAKNIGISIEWDEKLLVPLERALAKVIQEKSDLSKALEAFSDSAQSASVEEGLEKLKEIRKNLNSVISRSQELGINTAENQVILGELTEKIEKAGEQNKAGSRLDKLRARIKDNLVKPHLKTLLILQKSFQSAIERSELAGLDVTHNEDLSSELATAIAVAREKADAERQLNIVRRKVDSISIGIESTAVKNVIEKLKAAMTL
ncbi:uncharacterized protein METZ01_LOCUS390067, partial [marine metagenome]